MTAAAGAINGTKGWAPFAHSLFFLLFLGLPASRLRGESSRALTVFAASSLTEAFTELGEAFFKNPGGARVILNFAGSNWLRIQLEQGAQADVFATANAVDMEKAVDATLVSGSPVYFATNALILAKPREDPGGVRTLADLARPGVRLVLAHRNVPAGRYTEKMLKALSIQALCGVDFQERVRRNVLSEETNVKQVMAKVLLGEADAAFVYKTDITPNVRHMISTIQIPKEAQIQARYPVAVLRSSASEALGRRFISFLLSEEGRSILDHFGFGPTP